MKLLDKKKKHSPLPSIASLNAYAKSNVEKLITLHQKIELSKKKENIALGLLEQKRLVDFLIKNTTNGNAIMGLTTMRAMVITGMAFNRFFDYTAPYVDNRGYEKIQEFAQLENLVPLMQKYRTIEKANDIVPFVLHLPNLNNTPFKSSLFDLLNDKQGKKSFQESLFDRLSQDYIKSSDSLKKPIKNAIKMAMYKGYPNAALTYISILENEGNVSINQISKILKSIQINKYSSDLDRKTALMKLKNISLSSRTKTRIKKERTKSL